jgi:queuine tRNA-ribosyltransferase
MCADMAQDFRPIQEGCPCSTCRDYTRSALHGMVTQESTACHLISIHNIAFQLSLMRDIRKAIVEVCRGLARSPD